MVPSSLSQHCSVSAAHEKGPVDQFSHTTDQDFRGSGGVEVARILGTYVM